MLVHHVREFIRNLNSNSALKKFDRKFLDELSEACPIVRDDECLNDVQIKLILNIFAKRWKCVFDTLADYTVCPDGINEYWIKFAKALADDTGKKYLQILMPSIVNSIDPNNLSRLADCTDLRDFFCSDDKKILYRIRGLLEHVQASHVFSTHTNPKSRLLSPLSLSELLRIRTKRGARLQFELSGKTYQNFWDYLEQEMMPTWQTRGECPRHLLPGLLELIEAFFTEKHDKLPEFRKQLMEWIKCLRTCPVHDVNWLYAQSISVDGENVYLINILLDCLQDNKLALCNKMRGVARWLCQYDASFIVESRELDDLYGEFAVGTSFNLAKLQELLAEIIRVTPELRSKLVEIQEELTRSVDISSKIITSLRAIYHLRWSQISGKDMDYTRIQGRKNAPWIAMAQYLAGAGYIEKNYYRFLMPTIQHTMDVVRLECLTAFPLSHYILSEDGTHLILLDNCADNYRIHGNFSKIEETSIEPLTTVEEERIAYANPRFHKYIEILRCQASEQDPPISLKTIRAIKRLVDESLYPVGLLFGYDYDQKQMVAAERAYGVFAEFLHRMPQEERQKLNRQHIIFNNKRVTFAQVLRAVQQDECIAVYGQYLAQLVMDYAPYLTFQREIELRVDVNKMRSHSRQKVPSDYAYLSHEDALKRLLIIYKSLMTHNFSCWPLHGISISGLGVINTVPPEVNKIFSLLMPMVLSGNFIPAVAVYAEMMESVIKPALRDKSWKTWMTRYNDTHSWLVSIANQTLFTQKDEWFEPKFLLVTLFPLAQDRSFICPPLKVFLEKLVYIYLTSGSQVMRDAMINAQFATLLRDLDEPVRNYILSALKASEHLMVEDAAFHEICATQLIHRLALIGARTSMASKTGFFDRAEGHASSVYKTIKGKLQKAIAGHTHSLMDVLEGLQTGLGDHTIPVSHHVSDKMLSYLQPMRSGFLPAPHLEVPPSPPVGLAPA